MAITLETTQAPADVLRWTFDWTDELAENGGTIASAVVTGDNGGMVISGKTVVSPKVTALLAAATVPVGTLVALTCQATLSTGEVQSKTHHITIDYT